jgi:hypothetical protein
LSKLLEARSNPRFALFFIVFLSGALGFFASAALLHLGLTHMGIRYPLALLVAYGVFLSLLWLWLRTRHDHSDLVDMPLPNGDGGSSALPECDVPTLHPGDGSFGGGGASADFNSGDIVEAAVNAKVEIAQGAAESVVSAAGEGCGVVVLVFLGIAAIGAILIWVLSMAPVFLAEIVLDGMLIAALYKRLRQTDSACWLHAAVRRTWAPFLLTAIIAGIVGTLLHWRSPEAETLGYFLLH